MSLPNFSMRQLLEAGVHFGHHPRRWNPKMKPYIYGVRNNVHIIDLRQTVPMLGQALQAIHDVVARGGRILFVGTKRQASDKVAEAAARCGQYFVNHRWLGGMMTNWNTISQSIKRLKTITELLDQETTGLTKKELLQVTRERDKLQRALGGITEMGARPDLVIVMDTNKDDIAIDEAVKLGIPIVGIIDTNSDPDKITYPIPGNDDAIRAIEVYCHLFSSAVLGGLKAELVAAGVDVGAAEVAGEEMLADVEDNSAVTEKEALPDIDVSIEIIEDEPIESTKE